MKHADHLLITEAELRAETFEGEGEGAHILAQGNDIAPIPGTMRVVRVEESTAADSIVLDPDQLVRVYALPAATEERPDKADIAVIDC
jgi:hypothetical protein